MRLLLLSLSFLLLNGIHAQSDKAAGSGLTISGGKDPAVAYTLEVDTQARVLHVHMKVEDLPDTFQLAMFVHPEYDDQYWRYLNNLKVDNGNIRRLENTLWQVTKKGKQAHINYDIVLPADERFRAAWKPFMNDSGAMIGGAHSYLYIPGWENERSTITIRKPARWKISTALHKLAADTYEASSVAELVDAPILTGDLSENVFYYDGIPHFVVYYPSSSVTKFDFAALTIGLTKIVSEAASLFGKLPYRQYHFLIQDNSWGALEHANELTVGAPSSDLAEDISGYYLDIAHEYFHSWNLVRIKPKGYGAIGYQKQPAVKELWWSEGVTMYYADLLERRAGLMKNSNRLENLKQLIEHYYSLPGNYKISPEIVSLSEYGNRLLLGNNAASTHNQGELIATLLDLLTRYKTLGSKTLDDVMVKMNEKFAGMEGFTADDIEQLVNETCSCDLHNFFVDHIKGDRPLPLVETLSLLGLDMKLSWEDVKTRQGVPASDIRIYPYMDGDAMRIAISDAQSSWAKAGLNTGDQVFSMNGEKFSTTGAFFNFLRNLKIGDKVVVEVADDKGRLSKSITVTGYQHPVVSITSSDNASEAIRHLREKWLLNQ